MANFTFFNTGERATINTAFDQVSACVYGLFAGLTKEWDAASLNFDRHTETVLETRVSMICAFAHGHSGQDVRSAAELMAYPVSRRTAYLAGAYVVKARPATAPLNDIADAVEVAFRAAACRYLGV